MAIRVQLDLPRDARYVHLMRNVARCLLGDLEVPEEAVCDVQVVLSEACSNVVRHAEGTTAYAVAMTVGADGCAVEVVDLGPGFEVSKVMDPELSQAESGRGLMLMRALMDELQFDRQEDGTKVRLIKRWEPLDYRGAQQPAAALERL